MSNPLKLDNPIMEEGWLATSTWNEHINADFYVIGLGYFWNDLRDEYVRKSLL